MTKNKNQELLRLENISAHYGDIKVLHDISISINDGEIISLIGPNGSGKTTLLKSIFGLVDLSNGNFFWQDEKIFPKSFEMVQKGVSYISQGKQVFKDLSVYENLELGGFYIKDKNELTKKIKEVLEFFPALKNKLQEKSGNLSGGQQQMLTIARGLISNPKVLLLDEPSIGLSPKIVKEVFDKIIEINQTKNIAVIIVEHSINSVLSISDKAFVLSRGKLVYSGDAKYLLQGETLKEIFLAK